MANHRSVTAFLKLSYFLDAEQVSCPASAEASSGRYCLLPIGNCALRICICFYLVLVFCLLGFVLPIAY